MFKGLKGSDLKLLASMASLVALDPGEVVCYEGDSSEDASMYIVFKGSCQAVATNEHGEQIHAASFKEGESLGELGLLLDIPRTATVTACEKTLLLGQATAAKWKPAL